MEQPLVSVIIPNYCHARYLDERIQSVLKQTYQNFEIIILDDCSPDNGASREVIERYRSNPHVSHIVYNEKNSGSTFKQWDKGFRMAKGELIWIAESDDKCDEYLLEALVARMTANPNASIAFCRSIAFNENQGDIRLIGVWSDTDKTMTGRDFIHDHMRSGTGIVNASSAVFRKRTLQNIQGHYRTMKGAGDRMFWTEMAEQGDVIISAEGMNRFRMHASNSTKKFGNSGINQREDKVILDYIYGKGYITAKEYKQCARIYVRVHIFEMITDRQLKKELYKVWGYNALDQFLLRLESWKRRLQA